jgi:hypothetical protein
LEQLEIIVDAHERYPFKFAAQQAQTVRRALACGDYAVSFDGFIAGAVERKSVSDLVSSLLSGRLRYQLTDLALIPRAAIVVEQGYARIFGLDHVRGATVADGLAELQVRWPNLPIVFCENRKLAEEWTYRYLAACYAWARDEPETLARLALAAGRAAATPAAAAGPPAPGPSSAELRAWAKQQGLAVSDRGRISAEIIAAWHKANGDNSPSP